MDNGDQKVEKEFLVTNRQGIHARVAAQIADLAQRFKSDVWITKGNRRVSAKSILDLLTLACGYGSKVIVSAEGCDAKAAVDALGSLFKKRFGES
ncbi:MAG: HPr family phosphocarrier protein [Syntrophobacterales bacterium]|nr:HPr family phosphocarrier protein [Syntrophobacterales bacterium]